MHIQKLPDGSLSYLDSEAGNTQKPLVLLLHASASTSGQWRKLGERLAGCYRLLAPDLIGYGGTPLPASSITMADEVSRLEALVERLGRPFHLVAHSYGGAVALELARAVPHRVRSLALFEPAAFHLLRAASAAAWEEIEAVARRHLALVAAGALRDAASAFTGYWIGEGAYAAMSAELQAHVAAAMPKVAAEWRMALGLRHGPESYRALRFPVLLMSGGASTCAARTTAAVLREALRNPCWELLLELGHMGPVTHAAVVNARIAAFLDAVDGLRARAA